MNRILIAEDEERIASFLEKGLRGSGFVTTVVSDGLAAYEHARTGEFDLLILDIGLPLSDGFTVQAAPLSAITADDDDDRDDDDDDRPSGGVDTGKGGTTDDDDDDRPSGGVDTGKGGASDDDDDDRPSGGVDTGKGGAAGLSDDDEQPSGGVDTGLGGTADSETSPLVPLGLAGAAMLAGGGFWLRRKLSAES